MPNLTTPELDFCALLLKGEGIQSASLKIFNDRKTGAQLVKSPRIQKFIDAKRREQWQKHEVSIDLLTISARRR